MVLGELIIRKEVFNTLMMKMLSILCPLRLMAAMKTKDSNRNEYKKILEKVVIHLSAQQREKLPPDVKDIVLKAFQSHEERKKL